MNTGISRRELVGGVCSTAVMREVIKVGYKQMIYPEHERALDYDREAGIRNQYPGEAVMMA